MKKKYVVIIALLASVIYASAGMAMVQASEHETQGGSHVYVMGSGKTKYNDVKAGDVITGEIGIKNSNDSERTVRVSVAPYSNEAGTYLPVYTAKNYRTTLSEWIDFEPSEINIAANSEEVVHYTVRIPSDWTVGGGQSAALMFHTEGSSADQNGSLTPLESSFAHIFYMNLQGADANLAGKILEWGTPTFVFDSNKINIASRVKNTGNVIFDTTYKAEIRDILQNNRLVWENETSRETLPDSVTTVNQIWEDGPYFGLFSVSGELILNGNTEKFSKWVLIVPLWFVIIVVAIILLLLWAIIIKIRESRKNDKRQV